MTKKWLVLAVLPIILISLLFFSVAMTADDDDSGDTTALVVDSMNLSAEVWSPVNKIDNLNRDFFVLCHD
ncbi:hypothetical protein [Loigolactobacillus zhaoyuanensis]|uniref:Uncharacterized protein n=1 Tax=Loigolactobacillus zhaoyuanensis TaxID=2486017 RepID=A0ABW8UH99_9LACO